MDRTGTRWRTLAVLNQRTSRIVPEGAHLQTRQSTGDAAPGPQQFVLGKGAVLPAWELVAPTM